MKPRNTLRCLGASLFAICLLLNTNLLTTAVNNSPEPTPEANVEVVSAVSTSWIVQHKRDTSNIPLQDMVQAVGGTTSHDLSLIGAVAANLTEAQANALRQSYAVTLFPNQRAQSASRAAEGGLSSAADFLDMANVRDLHAQSINGEGITVAVLDSGLWGRSRHLRPAG